MPTNPTFHVRLDNGQQFGPADVNVLAQWAREGRVPRSALIVPADGSPPIPASEHPALAPIVNAPPTIAGQVISPAPVDDGVSTLIPYNNGPALIGYYISVASLIPGVGLILGPVAVGMGIAGWKKYKRDNRCKGAAHAWVAISLGGVVTLLHLLVIALTIISITSA